MNDPERRPLGVCSHGYCFLDPAKPCANRCRYLQAERALREEAAANAQEEDPMASARGLVTGLGISLAIIAVVVILISGGPHLISLAQHAFFSR